MKGFIVLLSVIALAASSNTFLRNLSTGITVDSVTAESTCDTTTFLAKLTVSLTAAGDITSLDSKITLKSGSDSVEYTASATALTQDTPAEVEYTLSTASPKNGKYTFDKIEDTTSPTADVTFDTTKASVTFNFPVAYTLAANQTKAEQEVNSKSDKAEEKSFTVDLDAAFTGAVYFYPNQTATKEISCKVSEKVVTCTPTAEDMENDKTYDIYYQSGCEAVTKAGVKVKFSASSFVALSKYALVAIALFLF